MPDQEAGVRSDGLRGVRPNEVRAFARRDMKLRREGGVPVGGFLSIREVKSDLEDAARRLDVGFTRAG